jgi:hypothetical protein
MSRDHLIDVLLATVLFVAIAIVIGTGIRIVDWITEGRGEDVWRVVVALIVGAGGGASALIGLRRRSTNGVE